VRVDTKYIEAGGVRLTVPEWIRLTGIPGSTIRDRMKKGWTGEAVLSGRKKS